MLNVGRSDFRLHPMNIALDLDGTLITCQQRQMAVLRAALQANGASADLCQLWHLKREGAATEQALAQLGLQHPVARRVAQDWQRVVEDPFWLQFDTVQDSVMNTLGEMRAAGAELCLITARGRRQWLPQQLGRLGLSVLLDQVIVVSPHDASTGKAAVLRQVSAVAYFGDTESDWRASVAAEVPFYAVATGQRSAAFLERAGVPVIHDDLAAAWNAFLASRASQLATCPL